MGHSDELGARVQLRPGGRHDCVRSRLLCVIIRLLFWATALHAAPHRVINAPCSAPALTGLGTVAEQANYRQIARVRDYLYLARKQCDLRQRVRTYSVPRI